MVKRTRAAPVGCRLPCSQFWSVFTLTPMNFANALWLAPNFCRKDCTSSLVWMRWSPSIDHARDARLELCSISPASCILAKSSPKFFLFMPICLRNLPHCLFLFLRQVLSLVLLVNVNHQYPIPKVPIVNQTRTTTFPAARIRPSNFSDATAPRNHRTCLWMP